MVLSGIYILDMKGKVLISRNYRGDIETNVIDKFIGLVMDREEDGTLTPLLQTEDTTFAFIRRNNLYVVATTKKNSNIAMVFCLLHKICAVSAGWKEIKVLHMLEGKSFHFCKFSRKA